MTINSIIISPEKDCNITPFSFDSDNMLQELSDALISKSAKHGLIKRYPIVVNDPFPVVRHSLVGVYLADLSWQAPANAVGSALATITEGKQKAVFGNTILFQMNGDTPVSLTEEWVKAFAVYLYSNREKMFEKTVELTDKEKMFPPQSQTGLWEIRIPLAGKTLLKI